MSLAPDDARDLAKALAAYEQLMNEVVPESSYHLLGKREDPERVEALGNIIERAAARTRARARAREQTMEGP